MTFTFHLQDQLLQRENFLPLLSFTFPVSCHPLLPSIYARDVLSLSLSISKHSFFDIAKTKEVLQVVSGLCSLSRGVPQTCTDSCLSSTHSLGSKIFLCVFGGKAYLLCVQPSYFAPAPELSRDNAEQWSCGPTLPNANAKRGSKILLNGGGCGAILLTSHHLSFRISTSSANPRASSPLDISSMGV